MFRKFIVWRISRLRKSGQTDTSVSEPLTALSLPLELQPCQQRGQRPAWLLLQLKERELSRGGDPFQHINSALGIVGK